MKQSALLFFVVAVFWPLSAALGQISYTGGTYTQDFDSMGSSGTNTPTGWFVGTGTTTAVSGSTVVAGTGSSATGGSYNFGVLGTNPVTDRSLGSLASSGNQYDTELHFTNNTGSSITQFSISYDGEQWRSGGTNQIANKLTLQLSLDGSTWTNLGASFNFTSPQIGQTVGALDGNASANRVAGIGGVYTPVSAIANGTTFYLRWADPDDGGSDAGMAIDNFTFTVVPEPGTLVLMGLGAGLLVLLQRARRRA